MYAGSDASSPHTVHLGGTSSEVAIDLSWTAFETNRNKTEALHAH